MYRKNLLCVNIQYGTLNFNHHNFITNLINRLEVMLTLFTFKLLRAIKLQYWTAP